MMHQYSLQQSQMDGQAESLMQTRQFMLRNYVHVLGALNTCYYSKRPTLNRLNFITLCCIETGVPYGTSILYCDVAVMRIGLGEGWHLWATVTFTLTPRNSCTSNKWTNVIRQQKNQYV